MDIALQPAFERVLDQMAKDARAVPTPGVAMVGVLKDERSFDWTFDFRVVDRILREEGAEEPANFFAVVCSKVGEMITTFKDSGSGVRESVLGETGFRGGAIAPHNGGYVVCAFSGGTSDEDYAISKAALATLKGLI
ncbi:MAG: hypothetical protein RR296_13290 [Clostridia bacterium]